MSTSRTCRPARGTLTHRLVAASILSVAVCLAGSARADSHAVSVVPQTARAETRIGDRTAGRQRGPDVIVAARLRAPHPSGSGIVTLQLDGATGDRTLGSAHPGANGVFSFVVPLTDALPGPKQFTLSFRPYDPSRYAAATRSLAVDLLTPTEYPFARSADDRSPTSADRLPSLWDDGGACSVGCRPVGAIDGWPLKPFHAQHALRAGFDEHRPSGFHIGIDIQAKDWSAVYAIQPGRARILASSWPDARVQVGNYIYWHIHPAVREGQVVIPYVTVLGHVLRSMGHLHLSEVDASGRYLNPLRPGGRVLFPYADDEPPVIGRPQIEPDGAVTIDVFDPQSFRVRTRYLTPVLAPAGLAYRLWHRDGTPDGPLRWALRATHLFAPSLVPSVFTASAHEPGYRCFATRTVCRPAWHYRLAGGLAPSLDLARDRGKRLSVYAWDWAGNRTARDVWL